MGLVLAIALLVGAAAGCVNLTPPPPATLSVSTTPALYPGFSPSVTDYVTRCDPSTPVTVSVATPTDTTVAVDGQPATSGTFTVDVTLAVGQSFSFVAQASSQAASTYYVRCLPSNFPTWTSQTTGVPQAEYYLTVPIAGHDYPVIFDTDGVPIWWGPASSTPFATLFSNGDVAWTLPTADEEHQLDGPLVRTITNTLGVGDNIHDLLLLPNGNYVLVADTVKTGVDLTQIGGSNDASVADPVVQEVTPGGGLVWSWDTFDHIPVTEMDPQWYNQYIANGCAPQPGSPPSGCDVYHWNSIEYADNGSSFILSFRHLDAVYDVSISTSAINWKLGGSMRPESLTVKSDPVFDSGSHLGGQHDARELIDGSGNTFVTLYDDGTNLGRAPRAVEYQLDTGAARTATFVDQATDPLVSASVCCGSARKLPGGDWMVGWGGTNTASELAPGGARVFLLQFASGVVVYRTVPISPGVLDRTSLRNGMDAQYDTVSTQGGGSSAPPSTPPKRRRL